MTLSVPDEGQSEMCTKLDIYTFISYNSISLIILSKQIIRVRVLVFNFIFNNVSVISWQSVLLVEKTRVPGENHQPVDSHWQTLSYTLTWVLLSLCKQTSDLSIGYNLISTCTGACDWLFRHKWTCWWIIVCSNLAA